MNNFVEFGGTFCAESKAAVEEFIQQWLSKYHDFFFTCGLLLVVCFFFRAMMVGYFNRHDKPQLAKSLDVLLAVPELFVGVYLLWLWYQGGI